MNREILDLKKIIEEQNQIIDSYRQLLTTYTNRFVKLNNYITCYGKVLPNRKDFWASYNSVQDIKDILKGEDTEYVRL